MEYISRIRASTEYLSTTDNLINFTFSGVPLQKDMSSLHRNVALHLQSTWHSLV